MRVLSTTFIHVRFLIHLCTHSFSRSHVCTLARTRVRERKRERERLHSFSYSFTFSPPVSSLHSPAHSFSISRVYTSFQKYIWTYFSGNIIQNLITRNDWIEWKCEYTWMWNWECEVYASVIEKLYIFRYDL